MRTWIVVCDGSRCRLFMAREDTAEWIKFEEFEHPASRVKSIGLVSDAPGRQMQSQGHDKRSAMDRRTDPHDVEEQRFAHYIADTLDSAHAQDAFDRLVLVAPPAFLGYLRKMMSDRVKRALYATMDKDYTMLDPHELQDRVSLPQ